MVLRLIYYNDNNDEISHEQISLVLGQNFVISFKERELDFFSVIRERIRNDGAKYIHALREVIPDIGCDKIQLNTVIRPPSEANARPLDFDERVKVREYLGERREIIPQITRRGQRAYRRNVEQRILDLVGRRPVTIPDISDALGVHENEVIKYVETLSESGQVKAEQFNGQVYYRRGNGLGYDQIDDTTEFEK